MTNVCIICLFVLNSVITVFCLLDTSIRKKWIMVWILGVGG